MRSLPLIVAVGLSLCVSSPSWAGDVFFADAELTPVTVEEDALGLWLGGGIRAWRTGDMALKLRDPADRDLLRAIEDWPEVAYAQEIDAERGTWLLLANPGVDEIALSTRIAVLDGVAFCHPDLEVETVPHTLDDPLIDQAWHLHNTGQRGGLAGVDVGAFEAWETATGEGQIIAIIDTGIDTAHPDLDLLPGYDFGDMDEDVNPDPEYSGYGHGTAMAGVAAAIGDNGLGTAGIAPDAQVLPIKIIGDSASSVDIHDAFVWSVDQGASVLSNSWGYSANGCQPIPLPGIIAEAFAYAEQVGRGGRGAAVAMSLGNGGCDASQDRFHDDPVLISVGAANDLDERVSYSNFGDNLEIMGFGAGNGRPGLWTTDITGEGGYNTDADSGDYWDNASGTSSACASVAGVLALMFSANERLTAAEAREVLCATAVKPAWDDAEWDAEGKSRSYGCGRIDAAAAVATVADQPPTVVPDAPGPQTTDRIRLSWTGQDPDGDPLTYRVAVRIAEAEGEPPSEPVLDEFFDGDTAVLDERLLAGSISYAWTVTPIDRWGPGEPVEGEPFTVSVPEEPTGGACSTVGTAGLAWLGGLGLLGLALARRRQGIA